MSEVRKVKFSELVNHSFFAKESRPREETLIQPNITLRDEWGALKVEGGFPELTRPVTKLVITPCGMNQCEGDACHQELTHLQTTAMAKGWFDIPYNFMISPIDGTIYEGRGWLWAPYIPSALRQDLDLGLDTLAVGVLHRWPDEPELRSYLVFNMMQTVIAHGTKYNYLVKDLKVVALPEWHSL